MRSDIFDFQKLKTHLVKYFNVLSTKGLYIIFLLFYAYKSEETPAWAKKIIIGSLAYFVSPIDSIPDLTPFIGLTDDMGVLSFGLVTIACYINNEVRASAKTQLISFLGKRVNEKSINEVNTWL